MARRCDKCWGGPCGHAQSFVARSSRSHRRGRRPTAGVHGDPVKFRTWGKTRALIIGTPVWDSRERSFIDERICHITELLGDHGRKLPVATPRDVCAAQAQRSSRRTFRSGQVSETVETFCPYPESLTAVVLSDGFERRQLPLVVPRVPLCVCPSIHMSFGGTPSHCRPRPGKTISSLRRRLIRCRHPPWASVGLSPRH